MSAFLLSVRAHSYQSRLSHVCEHNSPPPGYRLRTDHMSTDQAPYWVTFQPLSTAWSAHVDYKQIQSYQPKTKRLISTSFLQRDATSSVQRRVANSGVCRLFEGQGWKEGHFSTHIGTQEGTLAHVFHRLPLLIALIARHLRHKAAPLCQFIQHAGAVDPKEAWQCRWWNPDVCVSLSWEELSPQRLLNASSQRQQLQQHNSGRSGKKFFCSDSIRQECEEESVGQTGWQTAWRRFFHI